VGAQLLQGRLVHHGAVLEFAAQPGDARFDLDDVRRAPIAARIFAARSSAIPSPVQLGEARRTTIPHGAAG